MASAFSHAFVAIALGKAYSQGPMPGRFWVLSVLCAVLPDADVIGFALGVKYTGMLGHRGLSHSLSVAGVLGVSVVWVAFSDVVRFSRAWWTLVLYFSLVTASHGVLDAMTNGGLGIAFFAPFDLTRYFLPWRPVQVRRLGAQHGVMARGRGSLADATGAGAAARGRKGALEFLSAPTGRYAAVGSDTSTPWHA